jgi:hypothetical protein
MAVSNYNRLQHFKAGADLSQGHGLFVKMNTDGRAILAAAAADAVLGVVIFGVKENLELGVCAERGVKVPVTAAGVISVGQRIILAANGRVTGGTTGGVGIALEAAASAGQIITALFTGQL